MTLSEARAKASSLIEAREIREAQIAKGEAEPAAAGSSADLGLQFAPVERVQSSLPFSGVPKAPAPKPKQPKKKAAAKASKTRPTNRNSADDSVRGSSPERSPAAAAPPRDCSPDELATVTWIVCGKP